MGCDFIYIYVHTYIPVSPCLSARLTFDKIWGVKSRYEKLWEDLSSHQGSDSDLHSLGIPDYVCPHSLSFLHVWMSDGGMIQVWKLRRAHMRNVSWSHVKSCSNGIQQGKKKKKPSKTSIVELNGGLTNKQYWTIQYDVIKTIWYDIISVQYSTVTYNTIWYHTVRYDIWYNTQQYNVMQYIWNGSFWDVQCRSDTMHSMVW